MPKSVPDHELILRAVEAAPTNNANMALAQQLNAALHQLKMNKPQDRSDEARQWAIVITEMETVIARFTLYCL
jgi:hypothetical protein